MENANRRQQHAYRVSFADEVGSSFDPSFEDAASWEEELRGKYICRVGICSVFIH